MGFARPVGSPRRTLSMRTVALAVATVAMAGAAWSTGVALAHEEHVSRAQFAATAALAPVLAVYVVFLLQDLTWAVHLQGHHLVGRGLAGRSAVDLDRLTGAAVRSSDRGSVVVLRDGSGAVMVELQSLPAALDDDVAAALRAAQESGRLVLPVDVAQVFELPVAPGAPRGARMSARVRFEVVGVVVLLCAGFALGVTVG